MLNYGESELVKHYSQHIQVTVMRRLSEGDDTAQNRASNQKLNCLFLRSVFRGVVGIFFFKLSLVCMCVCVCNCFFKTYNIFFQTFVVTKIT